MQARRDGRRFREAAWALLLASLLSAGVVGVLLLNTAMQTQAVHIVAQQRQVTQLQLKAQSLATEVEQQADPAQLAWRARLLRMHPAAQVRWRTRVTRHSRAASRVRAG